MCGKFAKKASLFVNVVQPNQGSFAKFDKQTKNKILHFFLKFVKTYLILLKISHPIIPYIFDMLHNNHLNET